ncbi:hypothetical protein KIN20_018743 [Parelaphostrongylus tenuis]|uniref:Uncharacterized protein n=1 Tax=Parelaphostrongylus tenuis TaxID=148309 RepID=A0AAD5MKF3_PARTN|nr:hypothetical protein KIN20_018743 [Parelaphostrongylus tenuis]
MLVKLLELLNMIASSPESKMSPSALFVYLAPSFLNPAHLRVVRSYERTYLAPPMAAYFERTPLRLGLTMVA